MLKHAPILLLLLLPFLTAAQQKGFSSCGQKQVMQAFYQQYPGKKSLNDKIENILAKRNQAIQRGLLKPQRPAAVVTLPVVVHIIHNNGPENISDAQVFAGIQHLNEAFANTGYYDPADGVNTQIQFCLVQRDPSNNPTNGITRNVSTYTTMGGANYYSDDLNVKNKNRWDPLCYINIWLVNSIPGSVVGYAYLPSAHGTMVDGIIEEAAYFGSSYANDVVIAHEMGHYLGLYHTFEGACTNNDCNTDGDHVCDTPPDQSIAGISCGSTINSCTTDPLSGFSTDQADLTTDYMDYGNISCMKVFTQGQADRMNYFIQNVRQSLLNCKSCLPPCPSPVSAAFSVPAGTLQAGNAYTFTNASVNAAGYEWYVNGVLKSTAANFTYTFPLVGSYSVQLIAKSSNILCSNDSKSVNINVVCGVAVSFTKSATVQTAGSNINFTNTSTGADSYEWYVNGVLQGTATNFSYTSAAAGSAYIKLIAKNTAASCQQEFTDTVRFTCSVIADFIPLSNTTVVNALVTFTSTSTNASSYQWKINGVAVGSGSALNYTFTTIGVYSIQLVAGNGICTDTKYGTIYVTDKCGNGLYLFQNHYAAGLVSGANDVRGTADGGSILAGRIVPAGSINNYYGVVLKLDAGGNAEWMNSYNNTSNSYLEKIKSTADGGYITIGYSTAGFNATGKIFILKLSAAGAIQWSREFAAGEVPESRGTDIIESAEGDFYFTGYTQAVGAIGSSYDVVAGKIDITGNLNWLRSYDGAASEIGWGLAEDNKQLIICGTATGRTKDGFLLNISKADGTFSWSKKYQLADQNFTAVSKGTDGYYINATKTTTPGGYVTDHVYIKTDFTGKIIYSNYIQPFGINKAIGWAASFVKPNGNIISLTTGEFGGTYYDFLLQEVDLAGGILWTKKYNKPNLWMSAVDKSVDGGIYLAGASLETSTPPIQTNVMRLDSMGNAGSCPSEDTKQQLIAARYLVTDTVFNTIIAQPNIVPYSKATEIPVTVTPVCKYVKCDSVPLPVDSCAADACNFLKIKGSDTVCAVKKTVTYTIQKNDSCSLAPVWKVDTAFVKVIQQTDTTVTLQFLKAGNTTISASIRQVCKTIADTLDIVILKTADSINLGPDIKLCSFSTLKLSAGSGFKSYLWSDGSVDSVLTVYNPGQYFVTAEDYCGNKYADTINITQAPVVSFDLGKNLSKCNNDTVTITAPGNFVSYTWSPDYNINTTNGKTVKVWPAVDTSYIVIAEVTKGCTVVDSISIKVNRSAQLNIGNDTSFCKGGIALFKVPAGFSSYTWQDGSVKQAYAATQQGMYTVSATDSNGCMARDTALIKNVYPLPLVSLGSDLEICQNEQHLFDAGAGYVQYRWQDNSTNQIFTTGTTGTYWVQVTDQHGCKNADTAVITAYKIIPANFLDAAAVVCLGRSVRLAAIGNWQSYRWNTGETTTAINVDKAGSYWLEVAAANGCTARDTITVSAANCLNSIYFPTAFTPNNDSRNDTYKPIVSGILKQIHFSIYNRYGTKIFETTDLAKGWDGVYQGKPQSSNTFVWYCTYQFEGSAVRTRKGTVVLIR